MLTRRIDIAQSRALPEIADESAALVVDGTARQPLPNHYGPGEQGENQEKGQNGIAKGSDVRYRVQESSGQARFFRCGLQ